MRVQITRFKNAECFYIVKSVRKFGKNTNVVIEKLGNIDKVRERANGKDPYEWAREYAKELIAFCIDPWNTNENTTLKPLEKEIISDFDHSEFVVCTDAGLSSADNRAFNTVFNRRFLTVQSVRMFKKKFKDWTLADDGWSCLKYPGRTFSLSEINNDASKYHDDVFYKERWDIDNGLSQRFIVTLCRLVALTKRTEALQLLASAHYSSI